MIKIRSLHTEQQGFRREKTKGRRTALRLTLLPSSLMARESQAVSASATYGRSLKCSSEGKQCKVSMKEVLVIVDAVLARLAHTLDISSAGISAADVP